MRFITTVFYYVLDPINMNRFQNIILVPLYIIFKDISEYTIKKNHVGWSLIFIDLVGAFNGTMSR